jgi:hypothetical protein
MGILTIQHRMRELGRLRIGVKEEKTVNGKKITFPKKITTFRFTSHDKLSIEVAAKAYGGKVQQCDDKSSPELKGQWEVVTDASELPFYPSPVPPSQYMELWSGGGCIRRCDGCKELLTDSDCLCDSDSPECKPTTRLSLILPDIPDIGVWRIESHGWNAAVELIQTFEWIRNIVGSGRIIEARLALEERTGKKDGKTTRFIVPVIRVSQTPRELLAGLGSQALEPGATSLPAGSPQLPAGSTPSLPSGHETKDHVLKDANPRGAVFAILKEMVLPEHEGKAKQLYYDVFGVVLRMDIESLSALPDDKWQAVLTWLLKIKDGKANMPLAFTQWQQGKHKYQQHDPMAESGPAVPPSDMFADDGTP